MVANVDKDGNKISPTPMQNFISDPLGFLNDTQDRYEASVDKAERKKAEELKSARLISLVGRAEDEVASNLPSAKAARLGRNTGVVEFKVQPTVSESGSATYAPVDDIRQAASMLIYMGSPSREFSINAKFVARTRKEAEQARKNVQTLRSWRTPEKKSGGSFNMTTPSRLTLRGLSGWFNEIPVRLTNLTIESPEDVDYIKSMKGEDVPIVWTVNLSLKEARSANELKDFTIEKFRAGNLGTW